MIEPTPCSARLLSALTAKGILTVTASQMLELFMCTWNVSAYEALLMTGLLSEEELADALASVLSLPRLGHYEGVTLALSALHVVDFRRARAWGCLPLDDGRGGLVLACADACRNDRISELKQGLNREFSLAVGTLSATLKAIDELYPLAAQPPGLYGRKATEPGATASTGQPG